MTDSIILPEPIQCIILTYTITYNEFRAFELKDLNNLDDFIWLDNILKLSYDIYFCRNYDIITFICRNFKNVLWLSNKFCIERMHIVHLFDLAYLGGNIDVVKSIKEYFNLSKNECLGKGNHKYNWSNTFPKISHIAMWLEKEFS